MAEATEPKSDAKSDPKPDRKPSVKVGDQVNLVGARGEIFPAKVTKVQRDKLDLDAELPSGETLIITSSPHDPSGKLADSWHEA